MLAPGPDLLREMSACGMLLDTTHISDRSFWEALEYYPGPILASHQNCRALAPGERQFTDEQLKAIIERDGVVGAALDAWMLYPDWVRGETDPSVLTLSSVADHIDHICQLAGSTRHAAIGSDLDGGYGLIGLRGPVARDARALLGVELGHPGVLAQTLAAAGRAARGEIFFLCGPRLSLIHI